MPCGTRRLRLTAARRTLVAVWILGGGDLNWLRLRVVEVSRCVIARPRAVP